LDCPDLIEEFEKKRLEAKNKKLSSSRKTSQSAEPAKKPEKPPKVRILVNYFHYYRLFQAIYPHKYTTTQLFLLQL